MQPDKPPSGNDNSIQLPQWLTSAIAQDRLTIAALTEERTLLNQRVVQLEQQLRDILTAGSKASGGAKPKREH